ncbi:MAG: ShlB/FhaC/HecB family hemolysin secretion/activation protein [Elusimicrobiota bacterium]
MTGNRAVLLALLVLFASAARAAAEDSGAGPSGAQEFVEGETPEYSDIIIQKLTGLVMVDNPDAVVKGGLVGIKGVQNKGVPLLDDPAFKARMSKFLNKPLTMAGRTEILNEVVYYFREHGRPFVDVSLMPQDVTYGVLQILVLQAKVGGVRVMGGKWFSPDSMAKQVQAKPGEILDAKAIAQDLDWLNRNPFRQVDLVYVKGDEFGQANLLLRETDRFPLTAYLGYDDSGTKVTQNDRLSTGVNWGNAFGGDRQIDYNFLTSPDFQSFRAHSASFTQPLPWRHLLTFFGSYADIRADLPAPFNLGGFNWQTSARYEIPLPATADLKESVTAGFDYKKSNNNLTFGGLSVFATATEIEQWSLGYTGQLKDSWGSTSLRATGFYSSGGLTSRNNDASFQESRAGSRSNYLYGKVELNRSTKLPYDFMLVNLLTLQYSDANLLASEQLGFGGYDTVRGYDTRVYNSDSGLIATMELRSPSMRALSSFSDVSWLSGLGDLCQALVFVDYGIGANHLRLPGEAAEIQLWSAGPGVRYSISRYLTVRADYGWQLLNQAEAARPYASRAHLSAIVRY